MLTQLGAAMARRLDVPRDNPAFPLTYAAAAAEAQRLRSTPRALARPVVVLGGWRAWPMMARSLSTTLRELTGAPPDLFASLAFPWCNRFPSMTRRVVELVDSRWPSAESGVTTRVDVVGVSMGGLVARAAAAGVGVSRRLNIARLYTIATPHRGAKLARRLAPDAAARDMRPGSAFLAELDRSLATATFELTSYARLRDTWVGAANTAPPGHEPIWVSGTRILSHIAVASDPRIVVDLARRIRSDTPSPARPSPPPTD